MPADDGSLLGSPNCSSEVVSAVLAPRKVLRSYNHVERFRDKKEETQSDTLATRLKIRD
jgi:hypothetical protein